MAEKPLPRYLHESAVIGSRMWIWGGKDQFGRYFQRSDLSVYDPAVNTWTRQKAREATAGSIPPTSEGSRCTALGTTIYSYGGLNRDVGYLDELYALDTNTVTWRKVNVGDKKPAPRRNCGLCSTEGRLIVFGGYGNTVASEQLQEGAQWIQMTGLRGEVNNEFYEMNVLSGEWSDVGDSEPRPQPRSGHTLTAVGHRVILFGGRGADGRLLSDVHVFDTRTKKWSGPIGASRDHPWPQPRSLHTACPIHSDIGDFLLVLGGMEQDSKPCADAAYLFDIESLVWYEITNHALPLDRYWHTACCQPVDDHTTHAIVFGGTLKPVRHPQAVSSLTRLVLGPDNPAYKACERKRQSDSLRKERRQRSGLGINEETSAIAQLTERITELERAVRDSEQGKREAVALAQQHRDEIRRLRDDIGIKRNEAETARQEIDIGREENDIAREEINIARQEIELKTEEIDRLQRRVSTAEAARHEKEQQLNEYLNVLTIETEELTLDQAQLGSGAFGGVRAGHWRGVRVAVKRFHDAIMSPHMEPLCRRELSICSQLHHPHILQVYGAVMVNGTPLQLVMELMQGSVSDLIEAAHASCHYLSYREQIDLAIGSTAGIAYMHQLQPEPYVHSDIRSSNVMVTRDMVAKVGDLGASHVINSSLSVGPLSIEYVAPERMPRPNGMCARSTCQSDIYSLGVYLIELFNGLLPSPADRNSQLEQIKNDAMIDLCTLMTSTDPSQRPTAQHCFNLLDWQKEKSEYKMPPGRRLVKGHLDGQEKMSLIDHVYV